MWSTFKFDHAIEEADFKDITKFADNEYVSTYKLQLIAGRNMIVHHCLLPQTLTQLSEAGLFSVRNTYP